MTPPANRPAGLRLGNVAQSERAALKRRLADGDPDVARVIYGEVDEQVERVALRMTVRDLLVAAPGIGDATALDVCAAAQIHNPGLRLADLTTARRAALSAELRAHRKENP